MTDIMRLLPRCIYAGQCGYPCRAGGIGESWPLFTIKQGDNPEELVIVCHNYRKKSEGQEESH